MSRLFDGVDDSLLVNSLPATTYPLTMSCWFWPTNTTAYQTLMMLTDTAASANYHLLAFDGSVAGDPVQYQVNATGGAASANTSTTPTASAWNHACCVGVSATDRAVFHNGGGKGTNATSRTPAGLDRFVVGRFMASINAFPFTGRIAEAGVWSAALSDAEVNALAKGVNPKRIRPANLVFYAPVYGLASPETDYTAGQRHLTVTGATQAPGPPVGLGPSIGFWLPPPVPAGGATVERSATVDATGAVTAAATFWTEFVRTVALDATGAMATVPQRDRLRSVAIDATGAVETAPQRDLLRSTSLDAAGSVATAGLLIHVRSGALAATAAVESVGQGERERSASLTATATIGSAAIELLERAASLSATADVSASGARDLARAALIAAVAAVEAAGEVEGIRERSASLTATGDLTTAGQRDLLRSLALLATATVLTGHERELIRSVALDAVGSVDTTGDVAVTHLRAVALSATASVVVAGGLAAAEGDSEWMQGPINLDPVGLEPGISLTR